MEWRGEELKFSTGRVILANCRLIGINPSYQISEGYDGIIMLPGTEESLSGFTREEKVELANYMIALWTGFKQI